jgi:hypothetical protein
MSSVTIRVKRIKIDNINTFIDLYIFLQSYSNDNIIEWLNKSWKGKDKQESLLRLFAGLGLIEKLINYDVCKGNFNLKTIQKYNSIKDVFYNESNNLINLKDKGDSSDLTCISKTNEKSILVTSSKNLNKLNIGKLDIDKIFINFQQYISDSYQMSLCICIRNSRDFQIMKDNIETTSNELKNLIDRDDIIIIDWNDLNQAFHQFKIIFNNKSINEIITLNKATLCLKLHQQLGVLKTLRMKNNENKRNILWGQIQRSGKSYIIAGCIIQDSINKDICNYLVITTAPNETIEQQQKVFECLQLQNFNIIILNGRNKKPKLTHKNIIICSKQFLQTKIDTKEKTKSITWLKKLDFDMRFIDESHNGGTTELAQKTLDFYGKNTVTIQITATYSKPINDYNIPTDCWILWDLEDIKLCKNINIDGNIDILINKHGIEIENIINKYSFENIISEYSKYPDLWILTNKINSEIIPDIINKTQDTEYGWSPNACFLLKQGTKNNVIIIKNEFQNETETLKLWYRIFGKKDNFGIPDTDYPDNKVFIKRIQTICHNPVTYSRFIGEGDFINEPMIILAFLPQTNINNISKATIKLLQKHKVIPDYEIISINSKTTSNPKQTIEDARIKARNSNKKGVLVLSGKQCSLAVSINNCDIVLLLNNSMGFDMIYQMMFRCMTEGKNKKSGFVIDLNIHRVIETTVINYASLIKPDKHPKEATKYILQERLINLNGDHWMPAFGHNETNINTICADVYELYSSNTENALNYFLNRLVFKEILLSKNEQEIFNTMFNNINPTKQQQELIEKLIENEDDTQIKKGIEKIKVDTIDSDIESNIESDIEVIEDIKDTQQINYMDILKHIIPLICLLTIHNVESSFVEMFNLIESEEYIYNILIDQTKSWWGKNIESKIIKMFINVYIKYMKDDKETNQIIRTVKELFIKNVNNTNQLSQLIDKYLIPQELEKKSNAEISTPYKLRNEMLDKIPNDFWKEPHTVFEPCSGKGGFVIDIIDRFMNGLKDTIDDDKERYKVIVEECLYFSDINPTNIFICKLLIDPYNEYELNFNEGNTLELDIQDKWDIEEFDAVIGNPPYNKNLYKKFTDHCLHICKIILFVIPSNFTIGVSHKKFIENIKSHGLKLVKYLDKNIWNTKIDIDTLYFLCIKEYIENIYVNNIHIIYLKILNKIKNHSKLKLLKGKNKTLNFKNPEETVYIKFNKDDIYCYKILSRLNGGRTEQHYYTNIQGDSINGYKLLFPRGTGSYNSITALKNLSKPIVYSKITNEDVLLSTGLVYFMCSSFKEAEFIQWYLMRSKFVRFIFIRENKFSELTKGFINLIPNIDYTKINIQNDNNIYKYFNLTDEEIKLIESSI